MGQLSWRNRRMLLRSIPCDEVPNQPSQQAQNRADPKRPAPAVVKHHVSDQHWRNGRAYANAGKHHAVGNSLLLPGNPAGNKLVRSGKHDRFAGSQHETHAD